jgi:hypothetical protein
MQLCHNCMLRALTARALPTTTPSTTASTCTFLCPLALTLLPQSHLQHFWRHPLPGAPLLHKIMWNGAGALILLHMPGALILLHTPGVLILLHMHNYWRLWRLCWGCHLLLRLHCCWDRQHCCY